MAKSKKTWTENEQELEQQKAELEQHKAEVEQRKADLERIKKEVAAEIEAHLETNEPDFTEDTNEAEEIKKDEPETEPLKSLPYKRGEQTLPNLPAKYQKIFDGATVGQSLFVGTDSKTGSEVLVVKNELSGRWNGKKGGYHFAGLNDSGTKAPILFTLLKKKKKAN